MSNRQPPRWKEGPEICATENRPCFETEADLARFINENCPGMTPKLVWKCPACGAFHHKGSTAAEAETAPKPARRRSSKSTNQGSFL